VGSFSKLAPHFKEVYVCMSFPGSLIVDSQIRMIPAKRDRNESQRQTNISQKPHIDFKESDINSLIRPMVPALMNDITLKNPRPRLNVAVSNKGGGTNFRSPGYRR
jgi:hypothetical protein